MTNNRHCDTCDRTFVNLHAARQHRDALGHWECDICEKTFDDEDVADDHMEDMNHRSDRYCHDCDRGFQNVNNYQQHRNSRLHRGTDIKCPFCGTSYVTASGVSHHLETGSCPRAPSANRQTIFNALSSRDTTGAFTNRLIGWHGDPTYTATNTTFNGHAYECYLCHNQFRTLASLNQHLNSPRHASKLYHCPQERCGKHFVTLAALFSHLESETCGYVRFEQVQRNVGNFLGGGRALTFH